MICTTIKQYADSFKAEGETLSALSAEQWAALLLVERNETQTLREKLSTAERERDKLEIEVTQWIDWHTEMKGKFFAAEAELARVREALQEIADSPTGKASIVGDIARAALQERERKGE